MYLTQPELLCSHSPSLARCLLCMARDFLSIYIPNRHTYKLCHSLVPHTIHVYVLSIEWHGHLGDSVVRIPWLQTWKFWVQVPYVRGILPSITHLQVYLNTCITIVSQSNFTATSIYKTHEPEILLPIYLNTYNSIPFMLHYHSHVVAQCVFPLFHLGKEQTWVTAVET